MHQNLAIILRQLCYGQISFIVLVPDVEGSPVPDVTGGGGSGLTSGLNKLPVDSCGRRRNSFLSSNSFLILFMEAEIYEKAVIEKLAQFFKVVIVDEAKFMNKVS